MLALLASINIAVSFGTSGSRFAGAAVDASEVLSLRSGWSFDVHEIFLRGEVAALNRDCAARRNYYYGSPDCVSSKLLAVGIRRGIVGPVGVAVELGAGSVTGNGTTGFDRNASVTGTAVVPGATLDIRLPVGSTTDARFGLGSSLWLMSPMLLQYRAEIGIGANF